MIVIEFKLKVSNPQIVKINEAIKIGQFIRNKSLNLWLDAGKNRKINKNDLSAYCAVLAKEFNFADKLNSMARQASAERAWFSISRFYAACKAGKKGFPKFKKNSRSIEYKTSGWKLSDNKNHITFTDKVGIGKIKLIGVKDLNFYSKDQIKRVRIVKKADGFYCQFCIDYSRLEPQPETSNILGIDVGLESFLTDSEGTKYDNPRFYRKAERGLKKLQRKASKKKKGSNNRRKANNKVARKHLKVSRQRKDFIVKLARSVMMSNDIVVIEDLNVKGLVKNPKLSKSINDAGWTMFKSWLGYYSKIFNRELIIVSPQYTSQDCSNCGNRVKKTLSTRTHICKCGCVLDRDENAAINILNKGLGLLT